MSDTTYWEVSEEELVDLRLEKSANNIVWLYKPEKGDIFSVQLSTIDLAYLRWIQSKEIIPLDVAIDKKPIRKKIPFLNVWIVLPFIKRKTTWITFEFVGREDNGNDIN